MDPDTCLARIREELKRLQQGEPANTDLLEHFEALDEWLQRGGALPADWGKNR